MNRVIRPAQRHALLAVGLLTLSLGAVGVSAQPAADIRERSKVGSVAPARPPVKVTTPPAPPPKKREPSLKVSLSPDGETVYLVGMILEGSFHRFDAVLRTAPRARRVHLSSAGGYTIEARLIAALVRKRKLDSYVEFYCASACTQVFAAGQNRVIGPDARIGFHQAVMIDAKGMTAGVRPRTDKRLSSSVVFGVNGNDTLRLAYELAGIEPAFIDKALSYGHENMWLPSPAELVAARVVTRVADRAELPLPPGGGGPRDTVRARLLEQPLWRAGLAGLPVETERAIDDVWRASNSGYSLAEAVETGRAGLILAGSRGMARAPDALLERSLALYAGSARSQRLRGYPGCKSEIGGVPLPDDSADLRFEQDEDALVIDLLGNPERVAALSSDDATRFFAREVLPLMIGVYRDGFGSGREGRCQIGFRTFEAIDAMPPKKRLKAYRALLSLPGLSGS